MATISTNLTGPLTAAYPAKFAGVKKGKIEYFEVSSVQSGKFSDANICYAEMDDENESSLHFQNIWPILKFYVDESIGVKSIKIKSSEESITDDDNPYTITVAAPEGMTLYDVMPSEGQDKRICYVALSSSEVNSRDLSFEINTISQGTVTKTSTKNVSLERGYMYNVFIPYYVNVKVSDNPEAYQRWGYCNVGAFLPEDPGEYFSWGNTQGYVYNGTNWLSASDSTILAGGFCTAKYEGTNGAGISGRDLGVNITDDAAYANWDKGWRLPTQEELNILRDNLSAVSGGCGCGSLFLPAAGAGFENGIMASDTCFYWSSTIFTDIENQACVLCFPFNEGHFYSVVRYCGLPIRPIYSPAPEGALYGKFTINENGAQVYFSKGNLYYDEDSVPKFEANQYDYRIYCGKEDDQAVIGGVLTTTPSGNVGSFFWCDNAAAACAETYEDETPATKFFAEELIVDGSEYSSLTKAEWEYLLGTSTKRNGLYKTDVTINIGGGKTVMGLVVAPDGFNASNFKAEYTKAEWAEAESAYNLVFLPAVGWADDERTVQSDPGNYGYYWLKDYTIVDGNQWVSYLDFGSSYAIVDVDNPGNGYSVRLVKKISRKKGK